MKNTQNYYVYKADPKETTCTRCLNNHDRIFLEEDVPLLPVHPNCRCEANILRDIKINDSYIEVLDKFPPYLYDSDWELEKKLLIDISEDPQIQIFLVAQHLSDLKNVDFPDKSIDELTIDDIIVIANRYSIGPDHDIGRATIHDYGYRVVNAMEMLLELLE